MITFNYETDFILSDEETLKNWISLVIRNYNFEEGEINYIFCDDEYLHKLNVQFLNHDTLTDVISFDNSLGNIINGDIFISIDRVQENANDFSVSFFEELSRVMVHGVLHYIGFNDKSLDDKQEMTNQENLALSYLNY